jgi:prepilin-type N-terminal cleavage/methylation domain-containing protein
MKRGFSLPEIMVALVIMGVISTGVLTMFQYQNKNMITERAVAEMNLMTKGVSEEMSRSLRMAGGVLPPGVGGLLVSASGPEKVTVVLNRGAGVDTTRAASFFQPGTVTSVLGTFENPIFLPVNHVLGVFTDSGYVVTTVKRQISGAAAGTMPPAGKDTMIVLKILKLSPGFSVGPFTFGPVVVADGSWFASQWPWTNSVQTSANTFVYALDSVKYWCSADTVFRKINRNDSAAYALGIDSLKLRYMHPSGVWSDSLVGTDPANQIQKARLRIRVRTRQKDFSLAAKSPSTLGYHYQTIETEVGLRNASTLVNK